jgi:hypothetical protein
MSITIQLDRERKLGFTAGDVGSAQNILTRLASSVGAPTRITTPMLLENLWGMDHITLMVLLQLGLQRADDANIRAEKVEEWYGDYWLKKHEKTPGDLMQLLVEALQETGVIRRKEGARPPGSSMSNNG